MELRHLRYFVAVAEAGSFTLAAEERLHTAQPSLSRQMRDLEREVGVALMRRGARGITLTAAGRVFLDHARIALSQIEAAGEAARRAAEGPKQSFAIGFLTGYEIDWLPAAMRLLREELPAIEIVINSRQAPELAFGLLRGRIDVAFTRQDTEARGLAFELLRREPLIVLMRRDHPFAARKTIRAGDLEGQILIGVPMANAPELRAVTDRYAARENVNLTPAHEVDNLSMAISLVASTGGVSLLPLYARNFLPSSVVSRELEGEPPTIDLSLGYSPANPSRPLKRLLSRIEELKASAAGGVAPPP